MEATVLAASIRPFELTSKSHLLGFSFFASSTSDFSWVDTSLLRSSGVICSASFEPVDNNWIENQIRPIAIGRNNWLFAGSLRAGQRAAAVMSLIQSARMNGHDPWAYINDVLSRLPTHRNTRINELLPHHWHQMTLAA
jgi:hypothetical protein